MTRFLMTLLFLFMISGYGMAQFVDKYGINIGASYSCQFWDYKIISVDDPNKDYKIGFSAFLTAEKKINKRFWLRPEIGYIQKGFKNNIEFTSLDGTTAGLDKKNVVFHNLAANIGLKITPFEVKISPYILLGLRSDYMISYKDIVYEEQGSGLEFYMYKYDIDKFNKLNLGGLIGFGFELNDITYIEFEYNPAITKNYGSAALDIKDNCWELKVGFNINTQKKN